MDESRGHIVFDCDGTLISSLMGIQLGLQELFTDVLKRDVSLEEVIKHYTVDYKEFLLNFGIDITDENLVKEIQDKWAKLSVDMGTRFALFPGIVELIDQLISLNYKLYVWTARDRASTLGILKNLNIISKFEDLRCYDDTTPKPHPMGLEEMVGSFDKSKTVMIGDSTADIEGAKNFSCLGIAALWSDGIDEKKMLESGADFTAYAPLDCLEYIKKNIK